METEKSIRDSIMDTFQSKYGDKWKHHKTYLEKLSDEELVSEFWERAWEIGYEIGYDTGDSDARREREMYNQDNF